MVGQYYRWFHIEMDSKVCSDDMDDFLTDDLNECHWIDGLQRRVKLRKLALPEIMVHCRELENTMDTDDDVLLNETKDLLKSKFKRALRQNLCMARQRVRGARPSQGGERKRRE